MPSNRCSENFYPDQAEYESRLRIHLEYFNTQPYLASFILGAVVRLEEDRATGRKAIEDVTGLKAALMAPLGALGDTFFWGALKPFASAVTVALLMTGHWWAPLLFLVFYNICHVGLGQHAVLGIAAAVMRCRSWPDTA